MKPLIPYMRKSSREDPTASRTRQQRAIRAWARTNRAPLAPEVWEGGVSGSKGWRERGLGEAIAACERGAASGIVVEEQSRLSRENGLATAEVWEALERSGARLVCVAEGLDTAVGDQELNFAIKAALAREQWKQYARRAEAAKRDAVAAGVHIGPAPFGYVRPGHHAPLELGERKKVNAIRAAFELRARGATFGEVARLLDAKAPGGPSGRGAWNRNTVTRLLKNRVYLGEARGGDGHVKKNAHPAIVEDERTFDAVRALARHREEPPAANGAKSLLAGVARCGSCGYALDRNRVAKNYIVYRCRGRSATGLCEAPTSVMAHALDEFVSDAVRARLGEIEIERIPVERDVSEIHAKIEKARRKREPFEDPDYVAALGKEGAKRALAKVDAELAALEEELADAIGSPTSDEAPVVFPAADVFGKMATNEQREVVRAMIDSVIVSRGKARRVPLDERVRIVWQGEDAPIPRPNRNGLT